jgi:ribose transport system ATP-binding protein
MTSHDGIAVEHVSKAYGAVHALSDVSVQFAAGEVHAVVGHNGSGKSTLMKLLSGHEAPSSGHLRWDGKQIRPGAGIASVHQNLNLAADLTALENFGVRSGYGARELGLVSWRAERRLMARYCERIGVQILPSARVAALLPVEQAAIALAGCLRQLDGIKARTRFVLLDEVSTYYNQAERDQLAVLVRRLRDSGVGVLFISHYLDEVLAVSDRLSVLRSGRLVETAESRSVSKTRLIELMFGQNQRARVAKSVDTSRRARARFAGEASSPRSLRPALDADIRPGQILGLTGRAGMGHEEVPYALFNDLARRGRDRVAIVPADRARNGVWLDGTITENATIGSLRRFRRSRLPFLDTQAEARFVRKWLRESRIGVDDPATRVAALSGGTQQKVLLGRSLLSPIDILLLHEPTQGIDISARADIEETIANVAANGTSVVIVSSEYDELVDLCDRVLVFRDGVPAHEVPAGRLSEHLLAELA